MSTQSIPKPAPPPAAGVNNVVGPSARQWIIVAIAIAAGLAIIALPTPHGLSRIAQLVLGITAFTAVIWASQVINNGIASILMMGLLMLAGVKVPLVLSGFGGGSFWVLLTVLFYGFAMKKTGLAERISYYILSLFPGSYRGILTAFFVIGFVLALGIPSMTVRTAIMVPVAWALVQSLGLAKRSRGSALIILTTVEMAVIPGVAFLYGSLSGPVVAASFEAKHLPLTWLGYARVITFPTLLLCILILIVNPLVLRPEAPLASNPSFARDRLRALGPFKRPELITGLIVFFSIVYWTTDSYHHLPSFLIGMLAIAVFAFSGILKDSEISTGVSWPLLLFIGGIFGLANVIQEYKVTDWIAGFFVPVVHQLTASVIVLTIVVALAMYALRFLDPSSFIAISVLFLSVVDVTRAAGIPPLVLMAPIIIASVPFWMLYQNFWLAMGDGLTGSEAFTAGHRVRLANTYAVAVLITLALSVGYWKIIGIL
jgi:anion transporter